MINDELMSELETALEFVRNVERKNPDKSAYQIANILRGYTRKNYTTRLWSTATGYHQDYIEGEFQGKLNGDVLLSGETTDFGHFLASLSDQINQPGVQWSDLTQWTADYTAWAGDIGSAIIVYRMQYETLAVKSLSEALTRFARDSDYTADVAACVIGSLINSGRYQSVSQGIADYNSTAYSQQVKRFIQQRFNGIFQGNKLKNPAAVEAKMAQVVFLFVRLSNAPDIVASMKEFWQSPDQLKLSNIVQPQRTDILAGTLHFLAHLVKFGGWEPLTFKPYRLPKTKWLGSLNQVTVNGSISM
ncbi:hypothetical protein [Coleofasciculus sp. E2-BRE-01]|uniref:hypothetical protein n=1 Tax=Coleofasciculus sp. E2-BRE-01 TaxID=3069524 RepID=UPI0032FD5F0A